MTMQEALNGYFGKYAGLEQVSQNAYRLYAPFFHEDGDMYSIYLETEGDHVIVRDYGNTLMRVAYTFDLNTPNKRAVVDRLVTGNMGELNDGELVMNTSIDDLPRTIIQFSQIISKVSSVDILGRETVRSMFYDYLGSFITEKLSRFNAKPSVHPTSDPDLVVDYAIEEGREPLYLFGVRDDSKAAKVVISCLNFQKRGLHFRSVIIHEDIDSLTKFNRHQITNIGDKQFTSLDDFKSEGEEYLLRAMA